VFGSICVVRGGVISESQTSNSMKREIEKVFLTVTSKRRTNFL
jgi:hypothetical protein